MEKANILLVDDRTENLITLEAILDDLGQNLVKAHSGEEALRLVLNQDFAVILLDVQMPDMDGYETATLIRKRKKSQNIPIIFLTAIYESEEYISKGYSIGAVDYLYKPFAPEILHSKVMVFVELYHYREQAKQHALLVQSEALLRKHSEELEQINKKLEHEIIERKNAENKLKEYTKKLEESNRNLEDFAHIASHDLQEPLRKVLAFSDRLSEKYRGLLDETGQDYLKRMQDATRRMQILINDLLAYSRVNSQAHPFEEIDLSKVASYVISDLEPSIEKYKGIIEIDDLPTIQADGSQMYQLFQNLIANSLKFHKVDQIPHIKISTKIIEKDRCRIIFSDDGIGFDEKYLDRIFKPFQRLVSREVYEGTGMGLAICSRIVERHHGNISAKSIPGKGATFIVILPVRQSEDVDNHAV
jgi:signal transduction histidine kinase